jgi:heat shock protein HslJ/uncharacterized lipoprotein NlpE involved in copper resistance
MKKHIALSIASGIFLSIYSCTSEKNSTVPLEPVGQTKTSDSPAVENPALENYVAGSWQGQLPCADCEGIYYKLTLHKDKTYEESSEYKGKSDKPYIEKGLWNLAADSTVQLSRSNGQTQLRISGNTLTLLDQQGKPFKSTEVASYRLKRAGETTSSNAVWEAKRKQGIDFIGTGNGKSWSLEVDSDKMIRFQAPKENLLLSASTPTMQKLPDGKGIVYRAKTDGGTLAVRILNQPCTDKATGTPSTYTVEVTANAQDYMGCGEFLQDSRINGNWALEQLEGKPIKASDFPKGLPTMEIQLTNKKVAGNSGCNNFSGGLEVQGDKLTLGNLAGTRMACQGPAMAFETNYLKLLSNNTYSYTIEDDRLLIRDKEQTVLEYKKAE